MNRPSATAIPTVPLCGCAQLGRRGSETIVSMLRHAIHLVRCTDVVWGKVDEPEHDGVMSSACISVAEAVRP